jgi:ribosomal protein S18 acetylase RimI-like enzyme
MAPRRIYGHWAGFFGLRPDAFLQPGVRVVPHAGLAGYQGAWIFWRGETTVISVPEACVAEVAARATSLIPGEPATADTAAFLFGSRAGRLVGPAYHGYAERADFRPDPSPHVRSLTPADREPLLGLAAACDPIEWEHSTLGSDVENTFGYFAGRELLAACKTVMRGPRAADHGVITHPAHRGRGYGRAVVSASMQHALDRGDLVVYQTLVANLPAVAIARALGCHDYARHLAVRLR